MNESLIEELEYDLTDAGDLSEIDQKCVLKVFSLFANEVPQNDEEIFEAFSIVKVHDSETYAEEKALLISNYALYVLRKEDLNYVYRRIRLENIQLIILENSLNSMIVHMATSELLGDLWLDSRQIEDIHNCIQTMFKYLTRRYLPVLSYSDKQIRGKFNKTAQSSIVFVLDQENLQANNVVIQEGKIGENILFNKKAKTIESGTLKDCRAVLTSKAVYCLGNEFEFLYRLDLKLIKSLRVTEKMDKVVLEKSNGEELLWFLNSKFVTEIEKAIMGSRKERIPIVKKENINEADFISKTPQKLRRF